MTPPSDAAERPVSIATPAEVEQVIRDARRELNKIQCFLPPDVWYHLQRANSGLNLATLACAKWVCELRVQELEQQVPPNGVTLKD